MKNKHDDTALVSGSQKHLELVKEAALRVLPEMTVNRGSLESGHYYEDTVPPARAARLALEYGEAFAEAFLKRSADHWDRIKETA